MNNCLNSVGFVFDKAKICIKRDKNCRYSNYYCQECAYINPNNIGYTNPIPGYISPCNKCANNTQYKICVIKLQKSHFVSSSLEISTSFDESWEKFKNSICYQRNGNFVISVGNKIKNDGTRSNSFYANLIKAKKCQCCEAVILYFKYNILFSPESIQVKTDYNGNIIEPNNSNQNQTQIICANTASNITYNLKSGDYYNVKFFYSQNYTFTPELPNQI